MLKKYHIDVKTADPRFHPVGKYSTVEFREECAGSCRKCVKKGCVYQIFKENFLHASAMEEPEYLYTCMSCFRCIQECTRGIFSRAVNPDYRDLGDDHWRPELIHRLWYQAHLGKVPVSGAGYRGPFVGAGFDAMWTDMSEIIRPTRDGIHGREYISTSIELSRRVTPLTFHEDLTLACAVPKIVEIPIPLLFKMPPNLILSESILISAAKAAHALQTMLFVDADDYFDALSPYMQSLVPSLEGEHLRRHEALIRQSRAVKLSYHAGISASIDTLRSFHPDMLIFVEVPLDEKAADRTLLLARAGVDTVSLFGDDQGRGYGMESRKYLKDMIRDIHLKLVDNAVRQSVNLIFSGGIAMAEHMAKAIICGADGVAVGNALMLALECRLCRRCRQGLSCPVALDSDFDTDWGSQRIINLMGAWHSQLIEVMGAMGIREVRRLRGEVGRSMWFEDLERENFGPIFGKRKIEVGYE
jgi:ferredoxin